MKTLLEMANSFLGEEETTPVPAQEAPPAAAPETAPVPEVVPEPTTYTAEVKAWFEANKKLPLETLTAEAVKIYPTKAKEFLSNFVLGK